MAQAIQNQRWSLSQCYRYCERIARREAANFYHAFRLLSTRQRSSMCALYSFLRIADDLADDAGEIPEKKARLDQWRLELGEALQGRAVHPVCVALHDTVQKHSIPAEYLEAALDGVEQDLTTTHYRTFEQLHDYCYHVASVVGLSCIHIWGFSQEHREEALQRAISAGVALQMTNVLRDLAEDAARGRVYLPREDLDRFDYSEEELARGVKNAKFDDLMRFEIERARSYYREAELLTPLLCSPGRAVFTVMLRTYRALLGEMEQRDYNVFDGRVKVSRWKKMWFVLRALPMCWDW